MRFTLALAVLVAVCTPCSAQDWTGNVNGFVGSKSLDSGDWKPVESQSEFGILIDFKKDSWPVSVAVDLLTSEDTGTFAGVKVKGETTEFDLGVRKIWDQSAKVRPHIGGGLAFVSAEGQVSIFGLSGSADGDGVGFWVGGGIYWRLSDSFNLGVDVRVSQAEFDVLGESIEAGGTHIGLVVGYHW